MDESNEVQKEESSAPAETAAPASKSRKSSKFNFLGVGALLAATAVIGGLQYFGVIDFRSMSAPGLAVSATNPDEVLATVNGEDIKKGEVDERLEQISNVLKAQGADLAQPGILDEYKTRILDELIDNTLLKQAAAEAGVTVSEDVVEAEFAELVTMFGGEEALNGQLEIVGMSRDELMKNLREQKLIEAYVATHSDLGQIEVTDAEVKAQYDQSVAGVDPESVPPFDEVKDMLKQQIAEQKASGIITTIVQELKADASITKK